MKIVVFASGAGSTFSALAKFVPRHYKIQALIVDRYDIGVLEHAKNLKIPAFVVARKNYSSRGEFEQAVLLRLEKLTFDYIVLAGFMLILSKNFVSYFRNCIINIHPSLLPKYKGLNTYSRALEVKEKFHGCSVHLVDEFVDHGRILSFAKVAISSNETATSLEEKVRYQERNIYPRTLELLKNNGLAGFQTPLDLTTLVQRA